MSKRFEFEYTFTDGWRYRAPSGHWIEVLDSSLAWPTERLITAADLVDSAQDAFAGEKDTK